MNIFRIIQLLLIAIFPLTLFAQEKLSILTTEMPPYTGNETDNTGFLTIVVKAAFATQGIKTTVTSMPWKRAKLSIQAGKSDVIFPVNFEELLELNLNGVMLYNTPPIVFAKHKADYLPWNGNLNSLKNKNIAIVRGFSYTKEFDEAEAIKKYLVGKNVQVIQMLLAQRVDLALVDLDIAQHYISEYDKDQEIEILTPSLVSSSEFYMGFSGQQKLRELFLVGLKEIQKNGTYQYILDKRKLHDAQEQTSELVTAYGSDLGTTKGSLINSKTKKTDLKDMNIGFVAYGLNINKYQRLYVEALKRLAQQHGLNLIIKDPQASLDTQIMMLEQLLHQDVDAIIVVPAHTTKLFPVLNKIKSAGIPVISGNSPIDPKGFDLIRAYTGPNTYYQGRKTARAMLKLLNNKGTIVEIQGAYKHPAAIERSAGFVHELTRQKQANPKIDVEIIDTISGNWNSQEGYEAIVRLLRRNDHFDAVYVHDDITATGVIKGLTDAKLDGIIVVSSAGSPPAWPEIEKGLLHHTLKQDAATDARLAFETAVKVIKHEKINFYNFFETQLVSPQNVATFEQMDP